MQSVTQARFLPPCRELTVARRVCRIHCFRHRAENQMARTHAHLNGFAPHPHPTGDTVKARKESSLLHWARNTGHNVFRSHALTLQCPQNSRLNLATVGFLSGLLCDKLLVLWWLLVEHSKFLPFRQSVADFSFLFLVAPSREHRALWR